MSSSANVIASDSSSSSANAHQASASGSINGSRNPGVSSPGTGMSPTGARGNSDANAIPSRGGLPPTAAAAPSPANVFWALDHGPGASSAGRGNGNAALTWSVISETAAATTGSSQPLTPTTTPPAAPALAPSFSPVDQSIPSGNNMQSSLSSSTTTYLATPSPSLPNGTDGSGVGSGSGSWNGGDNAWASSSTTPTATQINLAPTASLTLSSPAPGATLQPSPPGSQPSSTLANPGPSGGSAALDSSNTGLPASALATLIAFPVSLALMFSAMVALIIIRRRHGSHFRMHTERDLESGSSHGMPPALPTHPLSHSLSGGRRDEHQHFLYRSGSAPSPPQRMSSVQSRRQPDPLQPSDAPVRGNPTSACTSPPIIAPPARPRSPKGRARPQHRHSIAIPPSVPSNSPRVHHQPHRLSTQTPPKPYRATPSHPPARPRRTHRTRHARTHPSYSTT
ncbi:hypothetical protein BCR44DRAFT_1132308 [Catenaria anguillulae PL171]|uniref:Uncharacterized protein n=1 Tax=Catenaria anguillulae PL171 TaxID=765915 RepID=A0A1Y2HM98_9FUNG|nr:hypothetical protein BCR44DRAFT_1132308 [Catenaria anguillulae PL171]